MTSTGTSSKTAKLQVSIAGGNYRAIDTEDGFFIVRDVAVFSEIDKDVKGAPKAIDKDWLDKAVDHNRSEYSNGKFASPLHIGHNKPFEITDPAFAGYFLLKRVGLYNLEGKQKFTIYADFKLTAGAFEKAIKGELPYVSVEVNDWETGRIDSISFLNSKPPFFRYQLFTISDISRDKGAQFEANFKKPEKDEEAKSEEEETEKDSDGEEKLAFEKTEDKGGCCSHCGMYGDAIGRMMKLLGMAGNGVVELAEEKAEGPVEQEAPANDKDKKKEGATKMEAMDDPKVIAKFAALEATNADLKKRLDERDTTEKAQVRLAKAHAELAEFVVPESLKATLAKFAAEEDKLTELVAELKKALPKIPPKTFRDFENMPPVEMTDPVLSKFQAKGPESIEKAAKFLSEFKRIKAHPAGRGMETTAEQYVESRMKEAEVA